MKRQGWVIGIFAITIGGSLSTGWPAYAAEHGGATTAPTGQEQRGTQEHGGTATAPATKEHGGSTQEHAGQAVKAEPSAEQIRQAIKSYVQGVTQQKGTFPIADPVTGTTRQLEFVRVHDRVGKTGGLYYSCTDMRDAQTKELLDLDFDVEAKDGTLAVVDQRIHKVSGQARYTYDEHDNRVPVRSTSNLSTSKQEGAY